MHPLGEVGPGRLEDQVKVIGHDDEGVEHPSRSSDGPFQAGQQPLAVGIVLDDVLPAVPLAMTW